MSRSSRQPGQSRTRNLRCILTSSAIAAVLVSGVWPMGGAANAFEPETPSFIHLTGVVRDFRERAAPGGHPDFEKAPAAGYGHYAGHIAPDLGADGKPVFAGGGRKVLGQYRDSGGRPISHHLFDAAKGDIAGSWGAVDTGGIESAESFQSWFRDSFGVNMSAPLTLEFVLQSDGTYVFDDKLDPAYAELGGFFPIEGALLGNPGGTPDRNFHFTFELHTRFTYDAAGAQVFQFVGDDDVWVFINGKLVIDLGGIHGATEQFVDISRLGLQDGESYSLDFFFAERNRVKSNFRIVTNLVLEPQLPPTVSPAFD